MNVIPALTCQQRFWLEWKLDPTHTGYNMVFAYDLRGPLDESALEQAITTLVANNEALRTTLRERDDRIEACIADSVPLELAYRDARDEEEAETEYELLLDTVYRKPFDLVNGPVFRFGLLRYGPEINRLVFCIHHLAIDGTSHLGMLKDLTEAYAAAVEGNPQSVAPEPGFAKYSAYEREHFGGQRHNQALDFWEQTLADIPSSTELPALKTQGGNLAIAHYFDIDDMLRTELDDMAHAEGATFFEAMAAMWSALLHKYTRQDEVVFSYPVSIRPRKFSTLLGTFVNNLPMRVAADEQTSFLDLLHQVSKQRRAARRHQHCSLTDIVARLRERGILRHGDSFLNVGFGQTWLRMSGLELKGLEVTAIRPPRNDAMQELMMEYQPADHVQCRISGRESRFPEWFVEQAGRHFLTLLRQCLATPGKPIERICLLDEDEKRSILYDMNERWRPYETRKTLPELFADQVNRSPREEAVRYGDRVLTYSELHERSDRLAHLIHERCRGTTGTEPETRRLVGLCMSRSEQMIVAIWAILKAGAGYVPLDPAYPPQRLLLMLEDAGLELIVTDTEAAAQANLEQGNGNELLFVDRTPMEPDKHDGGNPLPTVGPEATAYVIYTSGTTGHPKGVPIRHRQVANLVAWKRDCLELGSGVRMLQIASVNFDGSIASIFPALLTGACLCIASEEERHDAELLLALLERRRINCGWIPPALLAVMPRRPLPDLRTLLVAGESTAPEAIAYWSRNRRLVNAYGPTENTVEATAAILTADDPPNDIGNPIPNVTTYVLDHHLNPVPRGIPGELYIGGVQVFEGYLNRPELTAEKVVSNPFASEQDKSLDRNLRLYRTGDLARWLPSGHLEFIGRADFQVKVRGFRIEPGEIENRLAAHPDIQQALVLPAKMGGGMQLFAYFTVATVGADITPAQCREFLSGELPDYMVPAAFVRLDAFPMTPGGKIDRRALPRPDPTDLSIEAYVAPRNETERRLERLWCEALELERAGVNDNFFDIGGHSLLAIKLAAMIARTLHTTCTVATLFDNPTIAAQAEILKTESVRDAQATPIIPKAQRRERAPLSFAQQRLWFMEQLGGAGVRAYNMPVAYRLRGPLSKQALNQALTAVTAAQESLRTVFPAEQGKPFQKVLPAQPFELEAESATEASLEATLREETDYDFDLERGPLFRARLFQTGPTDHVLLLNHHHIISDGWSVDVLARQLQEAYCQSQRGEPVRLDPPEIRYIDYATWQHDWLNSETAERQMTYWRESLAGYEQLELPTDFPVTEDTGYEGGCVSAQIDGDLRFAIEALCNEHGVTPHMLLLAAYQLLLSRYTRQEDILVGSPVCGRTCSQTHDLIGFFVNTLPFRTNVSGNPPFSELLARVKRVCLDASANQDLPFDHIVEAVGAPRSTSRMPLIPVMFVLNETPGILAFPKVESQPLDIKLSTSKFDLMLTVFKWGHRWECRFEYKTRLFRTESVSRMASHFVTLLEQITESPRAPIDNYSILDKTEQRLLRSWNDTWRAYSREKTLAELFAERAQRFADREALRFEDRSMTYRELEERANRLANAMLSSAEKQGGAIAPGEPIALFCEPGMECIVGTLAILKAGGAYLPIKSDHPPARIAELFVDSGARMALTQTWLAGILENSGIKGINCLAIDNPETSANAPAEAPHVTTTGSDTAYLMYTSGSTGKPKGAMIPHRAVARLVLNTNYIDIAPEDRFAQASNIAFDAATLEIWGALLHGAALVCVHKETVLNCAEFADFLEKEKITVLWLTAALFHHYAADHPGMFRHLRVLASGGDVLNPDLVNRVIQCPEGRPRHFLNGYGPTENTTFTTTHEVRRALRAGESVPIGKPIANTTCYILDPHMQPVPVGVPGELYAGGDGVALGYLDQPELTVERFISNPFADERDRVAGRNAMLYRTGDLVRRLPDGEIQFIGRTDFQIKIRGFRVELGEIETRINRLAHVQEVLVLARKVSANKQLTAYYVTEPGAEKQVTPEVLREALSRELPDYMVPSAFVRMDAFPINPNGKVDRRALPAPGQQHMAGQQYTAPRDDAEKEIASTWCDLLGLEKIGIHDNFFDIGGHSLLATRLAAALETRLNVSCPVKEIFAYPTVADQARALVRKSTPATAHPVGIPKVDRGQPLPLSTAQQRLWFLDRLEGEKAFTYNMPMVYRLRGKLDIPAMETSLTALVQRHESLRTVFPDRDGEPYQQVLDPLDIQLQDVSNAEQGNTPAGSSSDEPPRLQLTVQHGAEEELEATIAREQRHRFDLARGPLFRVHLFELGPNDHVLLLNQHHIISDGWSVDVMMRELAAGYAAARDGTEYTPAPPLVQYADYAAWHRDWLDSDRKDEQLTYWKQALRDCAELELPVGKRRPARQTYAGANEELVLEPDLRFAVEAACRDLDVTPFVMLQAVFRILLHRYCRQDDIIVGAPATGRTRPELEQVIGFFVNVLPLRTDLSGNPTFARLVSRVRQATLEGMAAQDIPLDLLVEALEIHRDPGRMPLVQIVFGIDNFALSAEFPGLELEPIELEDDTAKFDATFMIQTRNDTWRCILNYNTDLFDSDTMHDMLRHFNALLRDVTADPYLPIEQYHMLTDTEYRRIVVDWNRTERILGHEDKLIHEIFEERAVAQPHRIAVIDGDIRLTYEELNEQANRLAHSIRLFYERSCGKAMGPNMLVGLCMDRGINMVTAMLGVLKAGGAYIPIDPTYPEDRIQFMLDDARSRLVLTDQSMMEKLLFLYQSCDYLVITVDAAGARKMFERGPAVNPPHINTPADLAYVIYTSGSTGKPKGVMIQHESTVNMATDPGNFPVNNGDRVAQVGKMSFDISTLEIWSALLNGAGLVILDKETILSPEALQQRFREDAITVAVITTALFNTFVETAPEMLLRLNTIMFGGEEANRDRAVELARRAGDRMNIVNAYGPTEITVDATAYRVTAADADREAIPIGKALANKKLYVLDPSMNPVPVGVPGELFIGGKGVARGYLNRPDLTAERFLDNPFATDEDRASGRNQRIYRTGDLVRWLPDGNLSYVGRNDFQVKINGFRIELGEIEAVTLTYPGVRDCVVLAPEIGASRLLVGYYLATGKNNIDAAVLREHLAQYLPDYMVPRFLIELDSFPLTPGGKVDRKALPVPSPSDTAQTEYRPPANQAERNVVAAMEVVLETTGIGIDTNFFDIGGTSLKAVALTARLQENYDVNVNDVFQHQTAEELARHISPRQNHLLNRLNALRKDAAEQANMPDITGPDDIPELRDELEAYRAGNSRLEDAQLTTARTYEHVLLTGATGFLGSYLLRELLEHSSAHIHTLIRADTDNHARQRLADRLSYYFDEDYPGKYRERLHVLCGDLAKPRLGMTMEVYRELADRIDCIMNSAALVKHYGHYEAFREANVQAVERLIEFAQTGIRKDLHHMSTISVGMGSIDGCSCKLWTEDMIDEHQQSDNYYIATKLEAEKRLAKARVQGLTVNVYRLGNVMFDSVTGRFQQNKDDNGFFRTIKAFCEIGAVPATMGQSEFSFVDQCATAVRLLFDKPALTNRTFHIQNSNFSELSEMLTAPELGLRLDQLPFPEFVDRLIEMQNTVGLRKEVETILLHRGWMTGEQDLTRFFPVTERTEAVLKRLGFTWDPLEPDQLLPMLHEALGDRIESIANAPFFRELDHARVKRLAFGARRRVVPDGTILCHAGQALTRCSMVTAGDIVLKYMPASGVDILIDALGPGRMIGLEALLDDTRSIHTVTSSLGEAELIEFDPVEFQKLVEKNGCLALRVCDLLANSARRIAEFVVNNDIPDEE